MEKREDFTGKDFQSRLKEGREKWEPFVIAALAQHGLIITPASLKDDKFNKIDGWLGKESVQIKVRNTTVKGRMDLSFELIQNYNPNKTILQQMDNPFSKGRDWRGSVDHYFLLEIGNTSIFWLDGRSLKKHIREAVSELEENDHNLTVSSFVSSKSIEIKATMDQDKKSHTPSKVMVFVPVQLILRKEIKIASNS